LHTGQRLDVMICIFAKIQLHRIVPCNSLQVKILIFAETLSFQTCAQTGLISSLRLSQQVILF
jgi:hypothetical protein